jgi:hypothetical protein
LTCGETAEARKTDLIQFNLFREIITPFLGKRGGGRKFVKFGGELTQLKFILFTKKILNTL